MKTAKRPTPIRRPTPIHAADDEWITVEQAADHLGVHHETIYDACRSRGLKHVKFGRRTIRLRLAWLDEWAEAMAVTLDAGGHKAENSAKSGHFKRRSDAKLVHEVE